MNTLQKGILIALSVLLVGVVFWQYKNGQARNQPIHYHAGFIVLIDGVYQDYSGIRYMEVAPCTTGTEPESDPQIEKAHLHDGVGDVVHVHRSGAVWRDLFTNIKVALPEGKPVKATSAGAEIPDFLDSPILDYQSVVITVGEGGDPAGILPVTMEHIQEVESKSEACAT